MSTEILIRLAGLADRDELRAMQAQSFRELGAACYERSVIEAFISVIGTMDDSLLEQGTYYAAVAGGAIVGCGGWSDRTPGYAVHAVEASGRAQVGKATVRSIFVHPAWARRGIASTIMGLIEAEIAAAGFRTASLTATLSGVPLYASSRLLRHAAGRARPAGGPVFRRDRHDQGPDRCRSDDHSQGGMTGQQACHSHAPVGAGPGPSAISLISLLRMERPKASCPSAARAKAPGPPMTLSS